MSDILISEFLLLIFSLFIFLCVYLYQEYEIRKIKRKIYYSQIQEKENEYLLSKVLEIK